jgi:hypothetical protein
MVRASVEVMKRGCRWSSRSVDDTAAEVIVTDVMTNPRYDFVQI